MHTDNSACGTHRGRFAFEGPIVRLTADDIGNLAIDDASLTLRALLEQFCRYDLRKGSYPPGEEGIAVSIASQMILLYITKALAERIDAPEPTTH